MSSGIPKYLNTLLQIRSAILKAVGSPGRGMRCSYLENLSTTTRSTVFPLDLGKSIIKSMARWDHGHGISWPAGSVWGSLAWVHTVPEVMCLWMSVSMLGHQYLALSRYSGDRNMVQKYVGIFLIKLAGYGTDKTCGREDTLMILVWRDYWMNAGLRVQSMKWNRVKNMERMKEYGPMCLAMVPAFRCLEIL